MTSGCSAVARLMQDSRARRTATKCMSDNCINRKLTASQRIMPASLCGSHGKPKRMAMNPAPVPVATLWVLQARGRWNLAPVEGGPRPVQATVRRDALLEDAFRALAGLGSNVKARLMVGGHAAIPLLPK